MKRRKVVDIPSREDIAWATNRFNEAEPRAVFYKLATWLMERALAGNPEYSESEALSVLLLTWNNRFYVQRRRRFNEEDYRQLDDLLERHREVLDDFRSRSILTFVDSDRDQVRELFEGFFSVVGATGVAKALHVRAPSFFPIWDSLIAPKAYGIYNRAEENYLRLIEMTKWQIESAGEDVFTANPVKQIDEWNYCRFSIGLPPSDSEERAPGL